MSSFLSNKFVVAKGTEQGHPLSPDLFKVFLADLSPLLEFPNCPVLSNKKISHLLWADDLILLALDAQTAQSQLNALANFCTRWGIEINELKTQAVIFGEKFMQNNTTPNFNLNGTPLQIVNKYCYLGIVLDKNGSVITAQNDLKTKAMRAFFGLKRSVMRSKLSFKAICTLFDSLIKPILLYGAPIWTPNSSVNKAIIKILQSGSETSGNLLKTVSRSIQEKVHISFLKWSLGVHRKSSNVGVWGETGRFPLIYQSIRLTLNYFKRISMLNPDSLVSAALREQKSMKLPWYRNIKPLLKLDNIYSLDHVTASKITRSNKSPSDELSQNDRINLNLHKLPSDHHSILSHTHLAYPLKSKKFRVAKIIEALQNNFVKNWEHQKSTSSKLSYYHSVKSNFCRENYLDIVKGYSRRQSTTQLRISAHDYEIERGRYKNIARESRYCLWCKASMNLDIVEDENHVLFSCDLYQKHRIKMLNCLNNLFKNFNRTHTDSNLKIETELNLVNLGSHLMSLLSPNTPISPPDEHCETNKISKSIHTTFIDNLDQNTSVSESLNNSLKHRQSYVINCVSTFIFHCSEEKRNFTESLRASENCANNIRVNIIRSA